MPSKNTSPKIFRPVMLFERGPVLPPRNIHIFGSAAGPDTLLRSNGLNDTQQWLSPSRATSIPREWSTRFDDSNSSFGEGVRCQRYRQDYGEQGLWLRPLVTFLEIIEMNGREVPRLDLAGAEVRLRDIERDDLPKLFEFQLCPEANRLAATNPRSADAFNAHWAKALADANVIAKAIVVDEVLAGSISGYNRDGVNLVGYGIGREFWGKGIATRALELFLAQVAIRPLYAHVAVSNGASLRVLQKCGFTVTGHQQSPADARYHECLEAILKLA